MDRLHVWHSAGREYVTPLSRNRLSLRVRVQARRADRCALVYWNRYREKERRSLPMKCIGRDGVWDTYEAMVSFDEAARYIRYYFEIEAAGKRIPVDEYAVAGSPFAERYFEYYYTNPGDVASLPGWARGAVYYQIFPDRFHKGNPAGDFEDTQPWGSAPDREHFTGGNLRGIIDRVDYLAGFGADILYLTPVFHARSNHRYDTTDYLAIDPRLGTAEDLKELVKKLHGKGMRILLDGVFNHCGVDFVPFKDVLAHGKDSRYRDWFFIEDWPADIDRCNYETVGYYRWMPKINLSNPEARDYMLDAAGYWVEEADIDGWRIDVADEVDYLFLSSLRERVKGLKADAILLGECWKDAGRLLLGDRLDTVMNYRFRETAVDFFVKRAIDTNALDRILNHLYTAYPGDIPQGLYNLLDSHDTERFLTLCGEDKERYRQAVAFQMTVPGAPAVYYGDEAGMTGQNDPDCRRCMVWEPGARDQEIYDWYGKLIALRRECPALRHGDFTGNVCEPGVYGFIRTCGDVRAYVVLNHSHRERTAAVPLYEQPGSELVEALPGDARYKSMAIKKRDRFHHADIREYHSRIRVKLGPYETKVILGPEGK